MLSLLALLLPLYIAQTCDNYGSPSGSSCLCPPGFNTAGSDGTCNLPVCGGSLYTPGPVAPGGTGGHGNISVGDCACSTGWQGPGCTGGLIKSDRSLITSLYNCFLVQLFTLEVPQFVERPLIR